jgi:hypothetical protein
MPVPDDRSPNSLPGQRPELVFHDNARQIFLRFAALRLAEGEEPYRGRWLPKKERRTLIALEARRRPFRIFEALVGILILAMVGLCLVGLAVLMAY